MEKIEKGTISGKPVETLEPVEVARALAGARGYVWLDTALPDVVAESPSSLMAIDPEDVVTGNIFVAADWDRLRSVLRERIWSQPDTSAAAIGGVEFEGNFRFAIYPETLRYNHKAGGWEGSQALLHHAGERQQQQPVDISNPSSSPTSPLTGDCFAPAMSREDYERMVRRAIEYIAAGDIYQVNLSQQFEGPALENPFAFYLQLREKSPAPMAAFLDEGERQILSSSMETFLQMSGRRVVTRPIKGTRPRGRTSMEDQIMLQQLRDSQKERAELVMITDLERNDLGQFCEFASVQVERLLEIEQFAQVFHQVSQVSGQMWEGVDHAEALRLCFPGGSISGAPKKRALEIIRELEPVPRGLYTGTIGYFGAWGSSAFNIMIRTLIAEPGRSQFHVGAGIVADSEPGLEYEETLHKARGLLHSADAYGASKK